MTRLTDEGILELRRVHGSKRGAQPVGIAASTLFALLDEVKAARSGVFAEVAAERRRQVEAEGWAAEHDDEHDNGELSVAAAAYATNASRVSAGLPQCSSPPGVWPWDASWWKPTTPRRDLIKAAALIVAEIERLDRAAKAEGGE